MTTTAQRSSVGAITFRLVGFLFLVELTRKIVAAREPGFVVAKGGITSSDLATAGLDLRRAWVTGSLFPGQVSMWRSVDGPAARIPFVVFPGNGYAAYYNQAVNKDAPHPAAARLWEEFLYSDQAQNLWLKGGARPVRATAMQKAGTLDEALWSKLPPAPSTTLVPSDAQSKKAGDLLGQEWAAAIS